MTITVGQTLEERIFDDVVTTLQGIDGSPDWNTEVASVREIVGLAVDSLQVPAIIVYHIGTVPTHRPEAVQNRMTLHLILAISKHTDNPRVTMGRFLADVATALRQTHTRGIYTPTGAANARNTFVTSTELIPRSEGDAVQQGAVTVEVTFAHLTTDPTAPK